MKTFNWALIIVISTCLQAQSLYANVPMYAPFPQPIPMDPPLMIPIANQSFGMSFSCPPYSHCIFQCTKELAACLEVLFVCNRSNVCEVDCISENACSYAWFDCGDGSRCSLACRGKGSCSFFRVSTVTGSMDASVGSGQDLAPDALTTSFGPILSKAFAMKGCPLSNYIFTPEYTLQMLSLYLPKDNETFAILLDDLAVLFKQLVVETHYSAWQNLPPYNLTKVNDYIVSLSGDVNQGLMWTFQNFMSTYVFPGVTLTSAHLDKPNFMVKLYFHTQSILTPYFPFIIPKMVPYFAGILRYPNNSFVNITLTQVNSSFVEALVKFYPMHCSLPVPFWGTYCLDTVWYSEGSIEITTDDLVATDTTHSGTLNISSTSFSVLGGTLKTISLMMNSGTLNIGSATLSVSDKIVLTDSTMIIQDVGFNITSNGFNIGENMKLIINLGEVQLEQLKTSGSIAVKTIISNSINGTFSNISFISSKGVVEGCISTYQLDTSLIVSLQSCDEKISYTVVASVTGSVIGLVIVVGVALTSVKIYNDKKDLASLAIPHPNN